MGLRGLAPMGLRGLESKTPFRRVFLHFGGCANNLDKSIPRFEREGLTVWADQVEERIQRFRRLPTQLEGLPVAEQDSLIRP